MDAIRRKRTGEIEPSQESLIENERIQIEFQQETTTEALFDEYPFDGQRVYEGILAYSEPPVIDGMDPKTEHYNLQFRSESGLFVIEGFGDYSRLDTVLTDTISSIPNFMLGSVRSSQLGLWSFVFSAYNQPEIVVRDFQQNEVRSYESMSVLSELSKSQLMNEYSLHSATVVFRHNDELINVSYRDGDISFADEPSRESREYVLQKIETHILEGVLIDELVNEE